MHIEVSQRTLTINIMYNLGTSKVQPLDTLFWDLIYPGFFEILQATGMDSHIWEPLFYKKLKGFFPSFKLYSFWNCYCTEKFIVQNEYYFSNDFLKPILGSQPVIEWKG